jgi:hypothetical protein
MARGVEQDGGAKVKGGLLRRKVVIDDEEIGKDEEVLNDKDLLGGSGFSSQESPNQGNANFAKKLSREEERRVGYSLEQQREVFFDNPSMPEKLDNFLTDNAEEMSLFREIAHGFDVFTAFLDEDTGVPLDSNDRMIHMAGVHLSEAFSVVFTSLMARKNIFTREEAAKLGLDKLSLDYFSFALDRIEKFEKIIDDPNNNFLDTLKEKNKFLDYRDYAALMPDDFRRVALDDVEVVLEKMRENTKKLLREEIDLYLEKQ